MNMQREQAAAAGSAAATLPRRWLGLVGVAVAAAILVGAGLGSYSLWDPDESKHAEVAREMVETGNWIEPQIAYQPYHHKPSLLYLLIGSVYRRFGVGEWQARVVPAIAGWLTLLAVYWYASATSARRGVLAVVLLASSPMFLGVARFTNFDALVTLFTSAAVLWLAAWVDRGGRGPVLPFYALVGLGVLAK
ncbi:MAG: phospholipid carrier-dependent glycosyltransferase, partial [Deltaproteobacteria bacterium]